MPVPISSPTPLTDRLASGTLFLLPPKPDRLPLRDYFTVPSLHTAEEPAVPLSVSFVNRLLRETFDFRLPLFISSVNASIRQDAVFLLPGAGEPAPIVYGVNSLDIDFEALALEAPNSTVAALETYVASRTPSSQNEYTGLFQGKNLIFITAEAFSREAVSEEYTPTLYRLMTRGINFTDYYQPAWGGSTSTGEYSNLTGLIPTYGVSSIQKSASRNMYFTLGNQLQRLNYSSFAYHNHTYTYYDRHRTHRNLGYSTYMGLGNGLEGKIRNQWPESDLELMQATVDQYIDLQPFSVYYMTISGHTHYNWGGNSMSGKNRDAVADMEGSDAVRAYIAANLELEYAMEYLIERLEEAGIADDTVIVLGSDHYPYGLAEEYSSSYRDALAELYGYDYYEPWARDHNALIIWCGSLEDRDPIVVDTPVYSLDIVPTVSNLMGLEYDSRLLVGRDVFSDTEPLVLWIDRSWMTDLARYNASTGVLTVKDGAELPEDYVSRISAVVSNHFTFSKNVLDTDFYGVLFGADEYP